MNQGDNKLALKVGAFVVVGLAVLAGLVVQFGRIGEGLKTYYPLTVRFPDASGLLKGSDVLLAGAKIGRVSGGLRLARSGQGVRGCQVQPPAGGRQDQVRGIFRGQRGRRVGRPAPGDRGDRDVDQLRRSNEY